MNTHPTDVISWCNFRPRYCPSCGKKIWPSDSDSRCVSCGTRYVVVDVEKVEAGLKFLNISLPMPLGIGRAALAQADGGASES